MIQFEALDLQVRRQHQWIGNFQAAKTETRHKTGLHVQNVNES